MSRVIRSICSITNQWLSLSILGVYSTCNTVRKCEILTDGNSAVCQDRSNTSRLKPSVVISSKRNRSNTCNHIISTCSSTYNIIPQITNNSNIRIGSYCNFDIIKQYNIYFTASSGSSSTIRLNAILVTFTIIISDLQITTLILIKGYTS